MAEISPFWHLAGRDFMLYGKIRKGNENKCWLQQIFGSVIIEGKS